MGLGLSLAQQLGIALAPIAVAEKSNEIGEMAALLSKLVGERHVLVTDASQIDETWPAKPRTEVAVRYVMATLPHVLISLLHAHGVNSPAEAQRRYAAHLDEVTAPVGIAV